MDLMKRGYKLKTDKGNLYVYVNRPMGMQTFLKHYIFKLKAEYGNVLAIKKVSKLDVFFNKRKFREITMSGTIIKK